ncbi:MAG: hypothetical protein AB7M12_14455 [Hyphomonadaceae bacterium]
MRSFLIQLHLLLSALGVLLPLAPPNRRAELGSILETIGAALALGEAAADGADALALQLKTVRLEIEAMAEAGRDAGEADLEAAFARVRAASAAFRAILSDPAPA